MSLMRHTLTAIPSPSDGSVGLPQSGPAKTLMPRSRHGQIFELLHQQSLAERTAPRRSLGNTPGVTAQQELERIRAAAIHSLTARR
jgi:hypothetical protein